MFRIASRTMRSTVPRLSGDSRSLVVQSDCILGYYMQMKWIVDAVGRSECQAEFEVRCWLKGFDMQR